MFFIETIIITLYCNKNLTIEKKHSFNSNYTIEFFINKLTGRIQNIFFRFNLLYLKDVSVNNNNQ